MPTVNVVDMHGKKVGTMDLSEDIFAVEVNAAAMHLVVRSYLAAQRQGTQCALTRGEVRGGGRKIYRQKGTGNARHHGNRAPQFRHGGLEDFIVVDSISLAEAKTRLVAQMLKELGSEKKTLLVLPGKEDKIVRASKNIPTVKDAYVNTLNVYDILNADKIVIEKDAMQKIQEVYA